MQLYSCFFNLALFELCYSSLPNGMLYGSIIYVLALINLKSSILWMFMEITKKYIVHRYIFIVAFTSIRPNVLLP